MNTEPTGCNGCGAGCTLLLLAGAGGLIAGPLGAIVGCFLWLGLLVLYLAQHKI